MSGDQPVKIEVAETPTKKVEIESPQVVSLGETSDKFWKRFSGDINLGMSYTKGNQLRQYNISSTIEYPRDRWNAEVSLNSNLSSSSGSTTSTRNQIDLRVNRLLRWNNFFYTGGLSFLQTSEQGINVQTQFAGGIGYLFKNSNRSKISLVAGFGWRRTDYTGSGTERFTQNSGAAIVSTEIKLFKFKKTGLNVTAALSPSVSEPGRVYFKINQSYYVKLFSDLTWNISFYGNWDNRPPNALHGSDYGTSTGLGWTFGNK